MEVAFSRGEIFVHSLIKVTAVWFRQNITGMHHHRFFLSLYSSPVIHYPSLLQDHKLDLLIKSGCLPLAFLKKTQSKTTKWARPFWCLPPGSSLNRLHPFQSHRRLKCSLDLDKRMQKKKKNQLHDRCWEKIIVKTWFLCVTDNAHKEEQVLKLMGDNEWKWHLASAISACNKGRLFN